MYAQSHNSAGNYLHYQYSDINRAVHKEADMNRREFLVNAGIALLALPAVYTLTGCGKSSDSTPAAPGDSFSLPSSIDAGHAHNIEFHLADFVNPPSGGKIYTSDGSTHQHTLPLTQQQLTDINNGLTVGPITSSNVGAHTHTWTIKK